MNILYIGDIMGEVGVEVVEKILPELRRQEKIEVVIAQAENVTAGKGLSRQDYERLKKAGIDGFTGGNWSIAHPDAQQLLSDPAMPVTAPANMPDCPGPGFKYVQSANGQVIIISLLGKIVGRDADKPVENPLQKIDAILARETMGLQIPIVVNFHGDFSSEKVVIGHYLDGRASLVVGDHWHVPTADARVLPKSTAHQTDVGMCGVLDSSLGITFESVIPRWRDGKQTRNILATEGHRQFNALLVELNEKNLATTAKAIRQIY